MTNLPINASTTQLQVSSKPASTDNGSSQGAQAFGDVLARQAADSPAPSEKTANTAPKDTASSTALADKNAPIPTQPDIASTLPADMLAALLVQQNPAATPPAATPLQLAVSKQIKTGAPEVSLATDKGANTPYAAQAGSTALSQAALLALDTSRPATLDTPRPATLGTAKDQQSFSDTLKAMGKNEVASSPADTLKAMGRNEVISSLPSDSLHSHGIVELTATALQPGAAAIALAQASSAPVVAATALAPPLTVSTPVNQAGWGNEFNQKITWLATQHDQSAELHLNPPQLGPLDVVLKVSGDQATALFTSPHAAVRDAIELALPKLREMLADNGIMLGNATVSDQSSRKDADDFARAQQGSSNAAGRVAEVAATGQLGGRAAAVSRHNGMVDTFA